MTVFIGNNTITIIYFLNCRVWLTDPRPAPPLNVSVRHQKDGLHITWLPPKHSAVPVEYYMIEYRTVGHWVPLIARVDKPFYTWKTASFGATYQFRVFCFGKSSAASESSPIMTVSARGLCTESSPIAIVSARRLRFTDNSPFTIFSTGQESSSIVTISARVLCKENSLISILITIISYRDSETYAKPWLIDWWTSLFTISLLFLFPLQETLAVFDIALLLLLLLLFFIIAGCRSDAVAAYVRGFDSRKYRRRHFLHLLTPPHSHQRAAL